MVGAIGVRISSLPGSVRKLGQGFYQISVAHREIAPAENSWVDSLMTDLLGPLEMKISKEAKSYVALHKTYKQSTTRQQQEVEKQESNLKSHRKKEKKRVSKSAIGDSRYLQAYNDSIQKLDNMRKEGLRKALLEERKLYCFTMEHFCNVFNTEAAFYAKSHEEITKRIPDLLAAASEPNELPEESAVLLEDPMSPKALQSPTRPSTTTADAFDFGSLSNGNSQDQDVFVFNTPQTSVVKAKDSVAALKAKSNTTSDESATTKPPDQPTDENTFNFVPQVNRITQATTPTQKTKKQSCRVKGLYEYKTDTVGQLQIKVGDLIDAISEPKDGWQYGKNVETGKKGWFPSHYVQQMSSTPESQRQSGKQKQPQIPPPDYD